MSDAMTVTYYATRGTGRANASDEDRAMAFARYYSGDSLTQAQSALYVAMHDEVTSLARPDRYSAPALRRAADILDAANEITTLIPESGKAWSAARLETANIVWQIVRTERPAR